jgi:hypothetical protein
MPTSCGRARTIGATAMIAVHPQIAAEHLPRGHGGDERNRDAGDHDRHRSEADAREHAERQAQPDQRDTRHEQRRARERDAGIRPAAEPGDVAPQRAEDDRREDRAHGPARRE